MTITFGIRREDKNPWERRVPFIPDHIKELRDEFMIDFEVQPSPIRAFPDKDYERVGAIVTEKLIHSRVIFAIKEIPLDFFQSNKTYVFFSHTAKGQLYNMPMLKRMMDLGCTLIDYEKIVDDKGCRLIAFGLYAGIVGMVESLWALGRRLAWEHKDNPFATIPHAFQAKNLEDLKSTIRKVGDIIKHQGFPASLTPFICGITGYGNVSQGAQEILELFPIQEVTPAQLPSLFDNPSPHVVYKVIFKEKDMVQPRQPGKKFNLNDYYEHPENYESIFENYLPYLTLLMNCILWNKHYPRLVTKKFVLNLFEKQKQPRLRVIGDISCDINGSIEFTEKFMEPDNPVFIFNPLTNTLRDGYKGTGIVVMAVDNLPCELPRESSTCFSTVLKQFIPSFLKADFSKDLDESGLLLPLKKAVVLYHGKLTPSYSILAQYLGGNKV